MPGRHARAGEPKRLVVLKGYGHYEVYAEPAFSEVMRATLDWYGRWLPPTPQPVKMASGRRADTT